MRMVSFFRVLLSLRFPYSSNSSTSNSEKFVWNLFCERMWSCKEHDVLIVCMGATHESLHKDDLHWGLFTRHLLVPYAVRAAQRAGIDVPIGQSETGGMLFWEHCFGRETRWVLPNSLSSGQNVVRSLWHTNNNLLRRRELTQFIPPRTWRAPRISPSSGTRNRTFRNHIWPVPIGHQARGCLHNEGHQLSSHAVFIF